jgi:predicted transcriptional regulator
MQLEERLKTIKHQIDNGQKPEPVTVRTFLSWFGSQRRGNWVVEHIKKELKKNELNTIPDFTSAFIDSTIQFEKREKKVKSDQTTTGDTSSEVTNIVFDELVNLDDPTYRISRLEAANRDLVYVKPDSELSEAITKMVSYDFSQLPVMQQTKRGLKGVISWKSIGMKTTIGGKKLEKVRDYMDSTPPQISSETSLFKALPMIIEHDYVLVSNQHQEICGIVTASDLSLQFKQLTEPFLLVSEIENHLRQLLSKLSLAELKKAKDEKDENREVDDVSHLTFGEYLRLFQNPAIWEKLHIPFDRVTFCNYLEKVKEIRNTIMHFDPDGLEDVHLDTLRNFIRLLQALLTMKK